MKTEYIGLWNAAKLALRGKYQTSNACSKKEENLKLMISFHLNKLEKEV